LGHYDGYFYDFLSQEGQKRLQKHSQGRNGAVFIHIDIVVVVGGREKGMNALKS